MKPVITRSGDKGNAIHVVASLEPNGSSAIGNWLIYVCKVLENGETDPALVFDVPIPSITKAKSSQIVEELDKSPGEHRSSVVEKPTERESNDSLVSVVTPSQLSHLVQSLTPGRYRVKVMVTNAIGKSPCSFASEDIDLGTSTHLTSRITHPNPNKSTRFPNHLTHIRHICLYRH
jgi:hypothetical protein